MDLNEPVGRREAGSQVDGLMRATGRTEENSRPSMADASDEVERERGRGEKAREARAVQRASHSGPRSMYANTCNFQLCTTCSLTSLGYSDSRKLIQSKQLCCECEKKGCRVYKRRTAIKSRRSETTTGGKKKVLYIDERELATRVKKEEEEGNQRKNEKGDYVRKGRRAGGIKS